MTLQQLVYFRTAAALVALLLADGRGRRWEGFLLVAVYVGVAFGFYVAGER